MSLETLLELILFCACLALLLIIMRREFRRIDREGEAALKALDARYAARLKAIRAYRHTFQDYQQGRASAADLEAAYRECLRVHAEREPTP